ncbi:MAG: COX15/CtaA family protein [Thaumarchaeota archaeon]|nr:COX15/CtaA family protein [Nitrososphaerota archaeon]MBI3023992.1 COX15/CtaA family protein [Nitrososphaerota archaeon]MBI3116114.1 COX15/CtaA family protein [Nitrososphaerota archaeon]MCS4540188.1 COX15/CtaA family protein [Nitrososphaerota archaeon]
MSAGKYLVYLTIVSTYVLIVWGAYLTAGEWGAACGTGSASAWPACNGSFAIPSDWGALVEYIHRALSIVATVLLLISTVVVSRAKPRQKGATLALLLSLALLVAQILLGAVLVNTDLDIVVTALHLANATALFGVMVVAGVLIHLGEKRVA